MQACVIEILLEHTQAHLSVAAFVLQWQNWVAGLETAWPAKSKLFAIGSSTEKVHHPMI